MKQKKIVRIMVEKLFGYYDYELVWPKSNSVRENNIMIIYGDNGTGKTTILKMLYNLLSPVGSRGHKSFLAKTKFKNFEVEYSDGTIAKAFRNKRLLGSYTVSCGKEGSKTEKIFKADTDLSITMPSSEVKPILGALSAIGHNVYYISDERDFYDFHDVGQNDEQILRTIIWESSDFERKRYVSAGRKDDKYDATLAVHNAEKWLNEKFLELIAKGQSSADDIILKILEALSESMEEGTCVDSRLDIKSLMCQIEVLKERNGGFEEYGLSVPLKIDSIANIVEKCQKSKALGDVLNTYVQMANARLDALDELLGIVKIYTTALGSLFRNKRVEYSVSSGINIYFKGELLKPSELSSGERQILLFFSTLLLTHSEQAVFIIDEPELSLNIKWQRRLLSLLQACSKSDNVQFCFATHSFEILSKYDDCVVDLNRQS